MNDELSAIWLTTKLAFTSTVVLVLISAPLAWWLAKTNRSSWLSAFVEALVALPLILPPSVIGFYLLIAFAPQSPLGALWFKLSGSSLAFSFSGLLLASIIYSLPFVTQPMLAAFRQLPDSLLESAATLGASSIDRFMTVALPITRRSIASAAALGFAHTVGEFGIVLMIGGSIPNETRVLSIQLYEQVEALQYEEAHRIAAGLMLFSFFLLLMLYRSQTPRATLP